MEDGFLNPCSSFSIRVVVDAFHSIRSILSFPSRPVMKIQYDSCKKSPFKRTIFSLQENIIESELSHFYGDLYELKVTLFIVKVCSKELS